MYFFFFNDTATTEIYTLSLHDALPIFHPLLGRLLEGLLLLLRLAGEVGAGGVKQLHVGVHELLDRKSTRLNSSHANISYAVFCLKKNTEHNYHTYSSSDSRTLTS